MPLPITDNEKMRLMHQIFSLYAQHGFEGISMDEISKQIKLSKATIYKYFKSKQDIVQSIVDERIIHLNALQFSKDLTIEGVLKSLSSIYFEQVVTTAYTSSRFMADLGKKYPDILSEYMAVLNSAEKRFASYFELTVQNGYCKRVSTYLTGTQVKLMLPALITPDFLSRGNLTLSAALKEYYQLILFQLISAEYTGITAQESTYLFIDDLVKFLKDRFLID